MTERYESDEQQTHWRLGPGRPLYGYRDTGEDVRHSRAAMTRAWVILGVLVVCYLAWTLTVFFLEPGLR